MNKRFVFVFMILVLLSVFISGCGKPKLYSKWRNRQITIDGKFEDWQNDIAYYDENTRVSIGVINDDTYLYICLITRNRGLMEQLMMSGFNVWFDPEGGSDKVFGIHFPLGMQAKGMPMEVGSGDSILSDKKDLKEHSEMFQESWQQIEIIGPGKEERYTALIEAIEKDGISVKMGSEKGYFVYELKVPLTESEQHPYYIGVNKNNLIGMGLEVSAINKGMPGGVGMPGGGGRGNMRMSGGGPGGGGGMPGSEDRGMPGGEGGMPPSGGISIDEKEYQLWMAVMLSSGGAR
jgi:hypothetical protein